MKVERIIKENRMEHYTKLTKKENDLLDDYSITLAGQHCPNSDNPFGCHTVPIADIKSNGIKSHYGNCRYCGLTCHMV